jgi:hypothetical protein
MFLMEILRKPSLPLVATTLAALAVLGAGCARGHAEAAGAGKPTPGVSADGTTAGAVVPTEASPIPSETDDGTGGTGDQNQANGGTEGTKKGPKSPHIFVLGDKAGSAALFGCMKDGGKVYTFGSDYIEGHIKGGTVTQGGVTKSSGDRTSGDLQHLAASHPDELLTGPQKIGGGTVDCGHPIDVASTPFYDESGPVGPGALQAYVPLVEHTDGSGFTVLATGHA